ncbi:MAG TPA: hypothetical protein VKG44_00490 [Candidatus Baltobacteraceae bacterium]|nr:hypothetical protein [Candidatus Baltobacteraceae bacterium]
MIHINLSSPAGNYSVGSTPFFRYVVRLSDMGLAVRPADQESIDILAAIPNAYVDEDEISGNGWRVVPAASGGDWPVLEATPRRLRSALETARRLLWENAAPVGITANEIVGIEEELENVLALLDRAEAGGFSVNVTYVS